MSPDPRTKIVCTLGPASGVTGEGDALVLRGMIDAGMDMARLNCSHGGWEDKGRWIEWLRERAPHIAILADLQGPKFRVGDLGDGLRIERDQTVRIGPGEQVPIDQPEILHEMEPGGRLLLGDGEIELAIVAEVGKDRFEARVMNGGLLKSRKGVTLVDRVFDVPSITRKDLEDVQEAVARGVDFIAMSYVKSAADLRELRRLVDRMAGGPGIRLCAKIETREAIEDLPNILKVADLVMVARGDLGLQMDIEQVPIMQKRIIEACTWAGVPVITATQMLESMIVNPRPTRAEATDIANAVLDGTDALMLSAETASGDYPVECVRTMARIAIAAEERFDRIRIDASWRARVKAGSVDHTDAIAHAVGSLAAQLAPAAIVTTTTSGLTPRRVSKFRPDVPILCATYDDRTRRQLGIVWGVEALVMPLHESTDETVQGAIDAFLRAGRLRCGDLVVVTAGVPAGHAGNTNLIMTQVVG